MRYMIGRGYIWGNRGFGGTGDLREQGIWRNRGFEGTGDLEEQGRAHCPRLRLSANFARRTERYQMERGNVGSIILSIDYLPK